VAEVAQFWVHAVRALSHRPARAPSPRRTAASSDSTCWCAKLGRGKAIRTPFSSKHGGMRVGGIINNSACEAVHEEVYNMAARAFELVKPSESRPAQERGKEQGAWHSNNTQRRFPCGAASRRGPSKQCPH